MKFTIDEFATELETILRTGGENGKYFVEFEDKKDSENFILDLVSELKIRLYKKEERGER